MYWKLERVMDVLYVFLLREWKFENSNIQDLWLRLSEDDRRTFPFSFKEFDWNLYIKNCVYGIRKYILRENISNLNEALAKNRR